jgi:dihydrolipoamide dehydrogenase
MAEYDVVVIGAGPGGYVAAIRAAQLGMKTAVVERDELGGTCLNWGCIPSKALLRNAEVVNLFNRAESWGVEVGEVNADFGVAVDRSRQVVKRMTLGVGYLLKKNNIDLIKGQAVLQSATEIAVEGTEENLTAKTIILATGARPRSIPTLPIDGTLVMTSREALEAKTMPKSAIFVGGGPIGCELAYVYNAYGVDVTIVEVLPHLLPNDDEEIGAEVERSFEKQGIKTMTGAMLTAMTQEGDQANVTIKTEEGEQQLTADRIIVAIGVQANSEGLGLEEVGVTTERGFITINERMQTSVPNIYAVGDITGKLLLAHVASAQGVDVVERLAGLTPPELDYSLMPKAVYCQPQVASFGITEKEAAESGIEVKVGKFPFRANGKALGMGDYDGFAKVVMEVGTEKILGAQMVGPEVTDLLGELSMNRMLEGTVRELGTMVHAHPSLSEVVKEAALACVDEAIHM